MEPTIKPYNQVPTLMKLQGMVKRYYMHNFNRKLITGFTVEDDEVCIQTSMKPVYLPLKKLSYHLQKEFLPA